MSSQPVPEVYAHLVNLAADISGTFVVHATDDFFAPKENLVRSDAPVWKEGEYTDRGKWMDGWESMRKRGPGHDHCIIRLGTPGRIHGLVVDTTHFKGNAPQQVSLETCEAPYTATAEDLEKATWHEALVPFEVRPDSQNVIGLIDVTPRATHVRFHIYPDGGVARLRVMGVVVPDERTFWRAGAVDLAAVENGGSISAASDQFFGPPVNLLQPGRGVNMGDGWETRRRRTPGSDWCVIKLGRRGVIDRVEVDTHFFKGNAPQEVLVEAIDALGMKPGALQRMLNGDDTWPVLVGRTAVVQHRRHILDPERPSPVTHLRVHMFPHGGINRLRAFGHAVDTPEERKRLDKLARMPADKARELLLSFNGSRAWVKAMLKARPYANVRSFFSAFEDAWWSLGKDDWLEAFEAHPRIGAKGAPAKATKRSAEWSAGEQSRVEEARDDTLIQLAELNEAYAKKFGFIYIVFATGRSAQEMLLLLGDRIQNTRAQELENAAREQAKITRLRMEKWLLGR